MIQISKSEGNLKSYKIVHVKMYYDHMHNRTAHAP